MVLLLLLGGSMGSFLNVVVDRGSRGVSIVRPGSQCPNCGLRLRFGRENLPLLGWLLFIFLKLFNFFFSLINKK